MRKPGLVPEVLRLRLSFCPVTFRTQRLRLPIHLRSLTTSSPLVIHVIILFERALLASDRHQVGRHSLVGGDISDRAFSCCG